MAIRDELSKVYGKFYYDRQQKVLYDRFPGLYRALVVETNDPLNMYRIRFKMPEMHNFDLKPEDCPWATSAFEHGGKSTGSWSSPSIGDIVWVSFEKQHPYGPVWLGHAEPTRRRFYKLHALYQKTQIYVDEEGKPQEVDEIPWIPDYVSKDGRPYSSGWKDRYGNLFIMGSTGFFPKEHDLEPAPTGTDAIAESEFEEQKNKPEKNEPDRKLMAMASKYGHYMNIGDQGYDRKEEFEGDHEEDYNKKKEREDKIIRLLNEDEPKGTERDQRRMEWRTSYGHKFELRDVGWAQIEPESKSRADDLFEEENHQSEFDKRDERWLKLRTKGGHILQFMDMGNDPSKDVFIRRKRVDEIGGSVDEEDDHWQGRDARQMRFVTRYGFKFVMDDRGSDEIDAEGKEVPRGNGWLHKGRRDDRGFGWEVNEKDELNRSQFYSPKSKIIEINDRYDYIISNTDMRELISRPWEKLKENEFATAIAMTYNPEEDTFHSKQDLANEYVRHKTPIDGGLNQGFEARNERPGNEVWAEVNDRDNRAVICFSSRRFASIHDPTEQKYLVLDDNTQMILVHDLLGDIHIHSAANVKIKADANIHCEAAGDYTIRSSRFVVNASGTEFVVDGAGFGANKPMFAPKSFAVHEGCFPGPRAGPPSPKSGFAPPVPAVPAPPQTPDDRGKTHNGPFEEVEEKVITEE